MWDHGAHTRRFPSTEVSLKVSCTRLRCSLIDAVGQANALCGLPSGGHELACRPRRRHKHWHDLARGEAADPAWMHRTGEAQLSKVTSGSVDD
jgi:hypothetical protein